MDENRVLKTQGFIEVRFSRAKEELFGGTHRKGKIRHGITWELYTGRTVRQGLERTENMYLLIEWEGQTEKYFHGSKPGSLLRSCYY